MAICLVDLGDDPAAPAPAPVTLESVAAQLAVIAAQQKADEDARKWALLIGAAGALFAAVKLGVIVIPKLRQRHAIGGLTPVANPRPRR